MARLDTGWHAHPKVLQLGLPAMGLHAWSISYCDCVRSDGFIPAGSWPSLAGARHAVKALVDAGLWAPADGGFVLHDYLDYNRSKAQIEAIQADDRIRKRPPDSGRNNGGIRPKSGSRSGRIPRAPGPGPGPGLISSSSSSGVYSGMPESASLSRAHEELLAEHERRLEQERTATTTNKNSLKDER